MPNEVEKIRVKGPACELAAYVQGRRAAPVVFMAHSVLASSTMWDQQAALLAQRGWRVVRADSRGHGESQASAAPYTFDDLVADNVAVLDALSIARVHYVGLSLGGMSGFGLGIAHRDRLSSLLLCGARADAPPAFVAPWNERIAIAEKDGCQALAASTAERWFGQAFVQSNPDIAQRFHDTIGATSTEGFVGTARALQALDFLKDVGTIDTPTTLLVGANDGPLPQAMREISALIPGSVLEIVEGAGHLPNIDQPEAFNAALLRHLDRVAGLQ